MTLEIGLPDREDRLPLAEDWRKPVPNGWDWIPIIERPPVYGSWVEVYEREKGRFREARLLEGRQWEFENGEKKSFASVMKWRDPELSP
jgi:hypothetical protein